MKNLLDNGTGFSECSYIFKVHSIAVFVMEYASVRPCSELISYVVVSSCTHIQRSLRPDKYIPVFHPIFALLSLSLQTSEAEWLIYAF